MRLVAVTFTKEESGMLRQKSSEYRGFREPGIRMREPLLAPACEALRLAHPGADPGAACVRQSAHRHARGGELFAPKVGAALLRGLRQMEAEGVIESAPGSAVDCIRASST